MILIRKFGRARLLNRCRIELAVLIAHRRRNAEHGAVMQRADDGLALVGHFRRGQLFWKAPDLAPASDR